MFPMQAFNTKTPGSCVSDPLSLATALASPLDGNGETGNNVAHALP